MLQSKVRFINDALIAQKSGFSQKVPALSDCTLDREEIEERLLFSSENRIAASVMSWTIFCTASSINNIISLTLFAVPSPRNTLLIPFLILEGILISSGATSVSIYFI